MTFVKTFAFVMVEYCQIEGGFYETFKAIEVFNWYYDYHITWQEIRLQFEEI